MLATKVDVRRAVEELFDVKVVEGSHAEPQGQAAAREFRQGTRRTGRRRSSRSIRSIGSTSSKRPTVGQFGPVAVVNSDYERTESRASWEFDNTIRPRRPPRRDRERLRRADARRQAGEVVCCVRKKTGGRNNQGKITVAASRRRPQAAVSLDRFPPRQRWRCRQGGFDSVRSEPHARIALLHYVDGEKRYILAPEGLKAGRWWRAVRTRRRWSATACRCRRFRWARRFTTSKCSPAAAACCAVSAGSERHAGGSRRGLGPDRRCPAAKSAACPSTCRATIGVTSNSEHMSIVLGKAGRKRWLGRRPHVRGTAMNPIDHPHGGGEGRTKGGRHPVSPHGQAGQGRVDAQASQAVEHGDRPPAQSRRYGQLKLS